METKNLAIMLTDIKGFTSKTAGFSRAQTQELLSKHRELVLPVILKFRGRLVKTIGDAFLAVFGSPTDAVLCGIEVQETLREYNSGKADGEKIEIRIAINSGEVAVHDDGDVYGDAVNVVSRLESIAEVGQVFFTESVYLAMNKREVPSSEIGYRQFKGVAEKIKVYRVLREVPVGSLGDVAEDGQRSAPASEKIGGGTVTEKRTPRVGFWRRAIALLIDVAIVMVFAGVLGVGDGPSVRWSSQEGDKHLSAGAEESHSVSVQGNDNHSFVGTVFFVQERALVKLVDGREFKLNEKDSAKVVDLSKQRIAGKLGNLEGIFVKGEIGSWFITNENGSLIARLPHARPSYSYRVETREVSVGNARVQGKKMSLGILLWALYGSLLLWRFGATPGKMILHLKVVDPVTGEKPAADKAFLRAFFSLVSLTPLMLGYLWAIWEKNGKTWHDIISGTEVRNV